jgi:hypothetical protein
MIGTRLSFVIMMQKLLADPAKSQWILNQVQDDDRRDV